MINDTPQQITPRGLVSHSDAIAYVTAQESQYEDPKPTQVFEVHDDVGENMVLVTTAFGEWGVWFEPDGTIYGEW